MATARFTPATQRQGNAADVVMIYQICLGRDPESADVIAQAQASSIAAFTRGCLTSAEFRAEILPALAAGRSLPHETAWPRPLAGQLAWLGQMIAPSRGGRRAWRSVESWQDVFAILSGLDDFPAAPPAPPLQPEEYPAPSLPRDFYFHLDSPQVVHGSAVDTVTGRLTIEGWALARAGVAGIDVSAGGVHLGTAQYGLARDDVGMAYPDWPGAQHCGYIFHIPAGALPEGQHLVTLALRLQNGQRDDVYFRIDVRASETDSELLGISQHPDAETLRYEQLLPKILPPLIDQMYRTILCRPADPNGLAHYLHRVISRQSTIRNLADGIYGSGEYQNIVGPACEQIRDAYRLLFEREPTAAETFNHVQNFRRSCRDDDEAIALLRPGGRAGARFGIRPLKIEIDITNQCNIRCIMCPFSDPKIG